MNKTLKLLSLGALTVSLGLNGAQSTFASEKLNSDKYILSSEEVNKLKLFLSEYSVDNKTQNKLIKKFNNGEVWDSINKNKKPVSTEENINEDGQNELISTYEDGSILVSATGPTIVEFDTPDISTPETSIKIVKDGPSRAVSPGTVTGGSGYKSYKKAKVYAYAGIANAHFYANFTIVQGGKDYISSAYDYKITGIGGTAAYNDLRVVRKTETLDNKASAKLDFTFTPYNNSFSVTCWLKLFVGGDKYSSDYSY